MNRQEILDRLRENERALRERGVTHAALFGSRARVDNRADSDTDIMVEIDSEADMSVYEYVGLKRYIAGLFEGPVDVIDRDGLRPHIRRPAESDNITLARSFVGGFDYERFRADPRTVYAVTRALEIISEASRRLPVAIKQRHPELPWADIAGAGSVYRHDYEDVRERRLWSALQKDTAPLLAVVEQELRDLGELP